LRISRLRRLGRILLDVSAPPDDLQIAADELHDMLLSIGGGEALFPSANMETAAGTALAPSLAASCLKDARRTAVFLRGTRAAIAEAQRRHPGERLNAVYAGTGPLASLVLPLLPFLSPDEIRFAFLDLHETAVASVRSILESFGFEGFAIEVRATDVATHRFPPDLRIHIAIVEVLQRALMTEPQVAITRNLAAQMVPSAVLVPECIRLDVAFGEPHIEGLASLAHAGTIGELTLTTAQEDDLPFGATLPMPAASGTSCGICLTHITVFGEHRLGPFESGLTVPVAWWDLRPGPTHERVSFWYESSERPGVRWRFADDHSRTQRFMRG
jgi:hypothetical protein